VKSDPDPSGTSLHIYNVEVPSDNRRGFAFSTPQLLNSSTPQLINPFSSDNRRDFSVATIQQFNNSTTQQFNFFLFLITVLLLTGCQPDLRVIEDITRVDESPVESTFNIEIVYSSGGIVRMIMSSPRMDRYETENPYLEMPEGLEVLFYDSLMNVTSSMTANYAISYGDNDLVEARNDVVVINELNERLNTEHLVWDQKKEIIFSDKFVKITREDEVLYGDGFESDERFNQWVIKKPRGTFTIDTDAQAEEE
jgi:LPS export ABC transporter protein LptC